MYAVRWTLTLLRRINENHTAVCYCAFNVQIDRVLIKQRNQHFATHTVTGTRKGDRTNH